MSGGFDTSQLRTFAADLRAIPPELARHAIPVVNKGALNIKNEMRDALAASTHFKAITKSVTYDVEVSTDTIEAQIGPDHDEYGGALANVAYFGTSRGGGSVADPEDALEHEQPKLESALNDLLDRLL